MAAPAPIPRPILVSADNFVWVHNPDGSWTVTDLRSGRPDGIDTLWNIELLQFGDTVVAIDGYTPPVVTNTAPTMTSTAPSVALAEWADKSANEVANAAHTASGALTYAGRDPGQIHTGSFKPQGANYLGTFALNTAAIDGDQSAGWSFTVSDSAIDYLKAGQTLTQKYDVIIDDGHGGSTTQTVTIALVGAGDAAIKTAKGGGGGRGNGTEIDLGLKAADNLFFQEMKQDQAAAPYPGQLHPGIDLPEIAVPGLGQVYESIWGHL